MKKNLLAVLFVAITTWGFGQQQPVISQYMLNNYYFNPAYTGSGELYHFSFLHRSQWSGYRDYTDNSIAPQTQLLTANMNWDSTGHAMGLLLERDKTTPLMSYQVQLSYAYRVHITEKSTLAFGVRSGIVTRSVDYNQYIVKHADDEYIRQGKQSETKPDVTLGLWLDHQQYYIGISARGMVLSPTYNLPGLRNEKTIVATAGYRFRLPMRWKLTPTIQAMTNTHQTTLQYSLVLDHENGLTAGLAYRQADAATLLLGFAMLEKKLRLSYAFDYTTGDRGVKSGTSHEIMLSYRFRKWNRS